MVVLSELDLDLCSGTIESASIPIQKTLRQADESLRQIGEMGTYLFQPIPARVLPHCENIYPKTAKMKRIIPHFVGVSGILTFPVTESCARHTLIGYKACSTYPSKGEWIAEFDKFFLYTSSPSRQSTGKM